MEWAGPNNNLWIVRDQHLNNIETNIENIYLEDFDQYERKLIELKANKQPVGFYENSVSFNTISFKLTQGDTLYFYSDGLADQFGGGDIKTGKKGGKKLKTKNLKTWVAKFSKYEMDKQVDHLETTFELWKGDLEQLDDVCMIGIRI